MLRSPRGRNEQRLRAQSFPSDQRCRSLLASKKRPVRHSAPLQLSYHCKAQEVSLIDSWRADSQSFSMAPARNYPMCEKSKTLDCDRISCSFKTALGAHIASQFNFDIEPKNVILVAPLIFV